MSIRIKIFGLLSAQPNLGGGGTKERLNIGRDIQKKQQQRSILSSLALSRLFYSGGFKVGWQAGGMGSSHDPLVFMAEFMDISCCTMYYYYHLSPFSALKLLQPLEEEE